MMNRKTIYVALFAFLFICIGGLIISKIKPSDGVTAIASPVMTLTPTQSEFQTPTIESTASTPLPSPAVIQPTDSPIPTQDIDASDYKIEITSCQATWEPVNLPIQKERKTDTLFTQKIETMAQTVPGNWGIYIKNIRTGETVAIAADEVYKPASTIKLAIGFEILYYLEHNSNIRLTDEVPGTKQSFDQLLRDMLIISSEDATSALSNFLSIQTDIDTEALLDSWEANQTTLQPWLSSPADLAGLLEKLYFGQILSYDDTKKMFSILHTDSPDDMIRIGKGLAADKNICMAHKIGQDFLSDGNAIGDVALVETPDTAYLIAVIANKVPQKNFKEAEQLITMISQLTYEFFTGQ
jgi:beta-lactamase class A